MNKVTLAITVVGGLVLFSGALILVGAVAMTKYQRVYEAAVFKTLGANTRTIARMLLVEYSVLGALAGLVGSAGAVGLTWGVSRYALEIPWRIFPGEHAAGIVLTALLVSADCGLFPPDPLPEQTLPPPPPREKKKVGGFFFFVAVQKKTPTPPCAARRAVTPLRHT